jgi:hypothetical protein
MLFCFDFIYDDVQESEIVSHNSPLLSTKY